ncbi:MAG: twitching motility protein [Planctomycetota bacterium]|nr:MAG: twitching motility protein [Planctomycetota bacterium]
MPEEVVLDTNVLIAGLRSSRGASHRVLRLIGTGLFSIHVSVPLVLEYEETLVRERPVLGLTQSGVGDVLDYLCSVAGHHEINFLWRPFLRDPDDDMVLELAVQAGCSCIVTHNLRDFAGSETFGVPAVLPRDFLKKIGATK